jgi:phytoene dehydrogenase-like protein
MPDTGVIVIGAGLSGLACARTLSRAGLDVTVLEASDGIGGRVRTDEVDGFLLDRGFQVFLTAYPEGRRALDLNRLDLQPFRSGAIVRSGGGFLRLADPRRHPGEAFRTLRAPVTTTRDKARLLKLIARLQLADPAALFAAPDRPTRDRLSDDFSDTFVDGFLRPFLGGIFLESELQASSRMFEFVFKMFASGRAAVPATGMAAIPGQLAEGLDPESIRLGVRVDGVEVNGRGRVRTAAGDELTADAVVIATDRSEADRLTGGGASAWNGTTCLYYAAPTPPVEDAMLVLNGEGRGPINNLAVMSRVAPTYAPSGRHLVSVTVLGATTDPSGVEVEVRRQLMDWFGNDARSWQHLRTYVIPRALPRFDAGAIAFAPTTTRMDSGVFVCGDHRANPSIDGALRTGRLAAEAVLEIL